ncbi:unnamed protein product [Aphanomyces euteiches]
MFLLAQGRADGVSTTVAKPPVDATTTASSYPHELKDEGHSAKQDYPGQENNYYAPKYGHDVYGPPRQESSGYGSYGQYGPSGNENGRFGGGYGNYGSGYGNYGGGYGNYGGNGFNSYGRGVGGGYANYVGGRGIGRYGGGYGY